MNSSSHGGKGSRQRRSLDTTRFNNNWDLIFSNNKRLVRMESKFETQIGSEEHWVSVEFEYEESQVATRECGDVDELLEISSVRLGVGKESIEIFDILSDDVVEQLEKDARHFLREDQG
jgi:hypothetical protein